ncbi:MULTISPECIES: SusC/RagA family TonB-linked outer membrane protein [Sphingobacterium]|uniref:SusC/RagA family TonB-linked outer membrane protein n=1 Tax=Sphingobacterium TaxID=28453 RepID=UPI001048A917|nr:MULTISPECIES: SusC/RagA family TonB-linked outer membrane protein [Sphingobacterium]MCW2259716.1 TonB-linked SusC/RagA family outer membrane protein [Sphingobacterium kitahiroshimense]TCR03442.1 TonB-linked SusC/RagA family outer membrane protein [Sphingobacterium sp. JUb78]
MNKTVPKFKKESRLALLLICLSTIHVQSFAYSQTEKIDVSIKGGKLEDVFQTINENSKYKMFFSKAILPNSTVNIVAEKISIKDVLSKSLSGSNLTWEILDNNIIAIKEKKQSQPHLTGQVLNENGSPLAGVSVIVKDWQKEAYRNIQTSTATDANGQWGLRIPNEDITIIFSFMGYQKVEISAKQLLANATPIRLKPAEGSLEEVVVIGYGTTTRRLNTGSVASITAKDIASQPVSNPLAALAGRMSGVLIAQNNGVPGSAVQIQIRNQASLSGTTSGSIPLYVVDGVPFTNFNGGQPATDNLNSFGISGSSGGLSPFSMINPADIERIDVLKDADATAIYGSRGANGVVLITTKKGSSGRTRIGVNFNTGFTEVNRFIPMMNLEEYLSLRKEAFVNDGTVPTATNAPDLLLWDQNKSTDWQKMLIGNKGHITDMQANMSGGNESTRFFFNSGYRRESTVFYGDSKNSRFTSRLNLDHTSADKKFNAALSVSYANDNSDMPSSDITSMYNLPPNYPIYDDNGRFYWLPSSAGINNPIAMLNRKYIGTTNNLISNANLSYKIIPGLTVKTNFGYTITQLNQNNQTPISSLNNTLTNPLGSSAFSNTKAENWIIEPTLDYVKNIGQGKLTALIGTSFQQNSSRSQTTNGSNYSNDALLGSLSAAGTFTASNNLVYYKYNAVFGKVNYDWNEKYLFNGTFRRDGSSRFGPKNRFGNFGAIGLGWVFGKEDFVQDKLPFLSFGKLRASYGTTGNDQISNYMYLPLYSSATAYLNNPSMNIGTLPNEYIKWETTKKMEFALDLGFLRDRILFTGNYFRNRSGDQITDVILSTQVGYNSYKANLPALIQNTGLELELNTTNIVTENFTWKTSTNFTFYKNKLVEFPGIENTFYASSFLVGEPLNLIRLYHYQGVDETTGRATYEDRNGDGVINADDRYVADLGTPFYGGFNNTFSYKGFELGVFFQFNHRFGVTKILNTRPGAMVNQNEYWLGRWSPTNPNTDIPGAITPSSPTSTPTGTALNNSYNLYSSSDAVYGDASYIKLRSINLSYNLPKNWTSRLRMSNCSVFMQGQNLFTWAKNKYVLDTETTVQGGPSGLGTGTIAQVLPPLRTIVFGFNCQF